MQQAHILYSGTVQGVGFRYTVMQYANRLKLDGWVKNISNGSVEILVVGAKKDIEQVCREIEEHFQGYIREKQLSYSESKERFSGFKITF